MLKKFLTSSCEFEINGKFYLKMDRLYGIRSAGKNCWKAARRLKFEVQTVRGKFIIVIKLQNH
jgi:hypothetical protein